MILDLESATVRCASSVDDILSSTLRHLQLKYPDRRFVFRTVDGKTRVRMPREELETIIELVVMNSLLFPRKSALSIEAQGNEKRYLLFFVCIDAGLNTGQAHALKNYRNSVIGWKCNQQMALCRSRLIVEFYGGRFKLNSEKDQGLSVTIALPRAEQTDC